MSLDIKKITKELEKFISSIKKKDSLLVKKINKLINQKIRQMSSNLSNYPPKLNEMEKIEDLIFEINKDYYGYNLSDEINDLINKYFKKKFCISYGDPEELYQIEYLDDELCLGESEFLYWYESLKIIDYKFNNEFWKKIEYMEQYFDIIEKSLYSEKVFLTIPVGNYTYTFASDNVDSFKEAMYGYLFHQFTYNKDSSLNIIMSIRINSGKKLNNEAIFNLSNIYLLDGFIKLDKYNIKKAWETDKNGKITENNKDIYLSSEEVLEYLNKISIM